MKKHLFVLGLAAVATLAACNKNTVNNDVEDATNLKIMILNRGYGTQWLSDTATAYETAHPEVKVDIQVVDTADNMETAFRSGKSKNDIDLFYDVNDYQSASLAYTNASIDGGLENLDDLYASSIPGENVTYGDKMNASIKKELEIDGHHYTASWARATLGIYYNETVLNEALGEGTWSLPNTSDELIALGKSFVGKGSTYENHFCLFIKDLDLISRTLFMPWWAQYEGLENYNRFWNGEYLDDATGNIYQNDVRIYTQEGRRKSLMALEPLLRSDGDKLGYQYAATAQADQFKSVQSFFYNSGRHYALYPSGDWLEAESGTGTDSVVKMMKLPVISSIIENLPSSSIKDDTTLSKVVAAIDAGETSYDGVADDDFARVKEARNVSLSMANFHLAYIPAYANAKKLAKDFLLFSATDEAIEIYKNDVKGGFSPFQYTYDESKFTEAEKSVAAVNKDANHAFYSLKNRLFYLGNALTYNLQKASGSSIEVALNVPSRIKTYLTPEQYYSRFSEYYANGKWQNQVLAKL